MYLIGDPIMHEINRLNGTHVSHAHFTITFAPALEAPMDPFLSSTYYDIFDLLYHWGEDAS